MRKIKILVIAPYEGLADAVSAIAQERQDVDMTVEVGDLDAGKRIAMSLAHNNYDIILSRGGTAELIRSAVDLPVAEISISGYDILRAIKLAQNYSGKFAIAGFSPITENAHMICDLLQYDIDIYTFSSEEEAYRSLQAAKKNRCTLVLCDITGINAAKRLNLNSILITSGTESIHSAIDNAIELIHSTEHVYRQKDLFQSLLTSDDREFLIYDPAGFLWFSSFPLEDQNNSLMNLVQTYLKAFLKVPNQTIERQIRDKIYTMSNRHLYYAGQKYTAITIKQKEAIFSEENLGFNIYNKVDRAPNDFMDSYSSSNNMGTIASTIDEYSKSRLPVLILGESGTGKDKAASVLYENGPFCHAPFYTINCELINERKWNTLLSSDNSPLNTLHTTIYIKNPGALSEEQANKLFAYLDNAGLANRNRLIFSLVLNTRQYPNTKTCRTYLENHFSCLTLKLPPLRERKEEIPSIVALYLHRLNVHLGRQIIGVESEAMELMTNFSWPQNLNQLRHILRELAVITQTPYISYQNVKYMLDQELNLSATQVPINLDLSQTMEEINYQIIQMVLKEENGSKEKTSRRLGISRSTLWRILKNRQTGN